MKLKKVTALLLATSMVLSSVSVGTFADELIFEPEVGVTATANEDEAYFGEEEGDVVDEQTATDDEAFFSDEVIDETAGDVVVQDEYVENDFADAEIDNSDIFEAIEAETQVADENVEYATKYGEIQDVTVTYDGKAHKLDYEAAGIPKEHIQFKEGSVYTTTEPSVTNVKDSKLVTYRVYDPDTQTWGSDKSNTITVEQKAITATLTTTTYGYGQTVDALSVKSFTYDGIVEGEEPSSVLALTSGYEWSKVSFYAKTTGGWDTTPTTVSSVSKLPAGTYKATFGSAFDSASKNYSTTVNECIVTVTPKSLTVTWDAATKTAEYSDSNLSHNAYAEGYAFKYKNDSNTAKAVGKYTAEIEAVSTGSTYDSSKDVTSSFTITNPTDDWEIVKKKLYAATDTGVITTIEYGSEDPTLILENVTLAYYGKPDDVASAVSAPSDITGTAKYATSYQKYDDVGNYLIKYVSGLTSDGYEVLAADESLNKATFTVTPARVKIVPTAVTVAVGDDPVEPTYTFTDAVLGSGSAKVLQHDLDAGLVNLSVYTLAKDTSFTEDESFGATKVTPLEVGEYQYGWTIEDAKKNSKKSLNFINSASPYHSAESTLIDTTKKYTVSKSKVKLTFADYKGVYDGKKHGIVITPDPLPEGITIYYSENALNNRTDAQAASTTPITAVDVTATPVKVYYYVIDANDDDPTHDIKGSNTITITSADKAAAEAVEKQIEEAVKKDESGKLDPEKVKEAREAYEALTNTQKDMVSPYSLKELKEAEAAIAASAEADAKAVEEQIAKLPVPEEVTEADKEAIEAAKKAYDALSDDAKAKVSKDAKDKLDADVKALEDEEEADKKAAKAVEDAIAALPEADQATAADKAAADAAKEAYDALTDAQKALVPADAVEKMNAVKAAADAAAEEDEKAEKERELFDEAVALVKAQKNGVDGKAAAENAKKAYDNLSDAAKAKLTDEEIKAYEDAQKAYTKDYTFNSGEGVFRVLSNGEVTYLKPLHPENTWFVVPNQLKKNGFTYKVVKVSTKAFMGCTKATKIKIGKNVQSIGAYAFKNTPAMTKLIMLTSKLASGKVTNSFGGAGKEKGAKLTNEVPNGKSSAYESLFKGEGGMNAGAKFTEAN